MARINRSSVIQKAVNDLGISAAGEKIPNETLDKVQLIYKLNPEYSNIVRNFDKSTTGSSTIYSVGSKEDFYLTSITLAATADVVYDGTSVPVNATVDGVSRRLLVLKHPATSAFGNVNTNIDYSHPIKIDKGTNITIAPSFSAGALLASVCITGISLTSN
jgi:hypothetical protein